MNRGCYFSSGYESPAYGGGRSAAPAAGLPAGLRRTGPAALLLPGNKPQKVGQAKSQPSFQARMDGGSSFKAPLGWRARKVICSLTSGDFLLLLPFPSLAASAVAGATPTSGLGARAAFAAFISVSLQEEGQERRGSHLMEGRELCLSAAWREGIFTSPTVPSRRFSKGKFFDNSPPLLSFVYQSLES